MPRMGCLPTACQEDPRDREGYGGGSTTQALVGPPRPSQDRCWPDPTGHQQYALRLVTSFSGPQFSPAQKTTRGGEVLP